MVSRYVSHGSYRVSTPQGVPHSIAPENLDDDLDISKLVRVVVTVEKGPIRWNSIPAQTVTTDGSDGSTLAYEGAVIIVWGHQDGPDFRFTGVDSVGTIMVRFEGTG